ncbi:MAG: hypothetical protein IPL00_08325 [Gammaproteobacteria bacterium]|nr:hypothetical protein [Gammaproteobacteria bacterium]
MMIGRAAQGRHGSARALTAHCGADTGASLHHRAPLRRLMLGHLQALHGF